MNLTVKITGSKEELARFKKLGDKLTDFSSAMKDVSRELKHYYEYNVFESQGAVYGKKWAALSPVYKERKGRTHPGAYILVASGAMRGNFQGISTRNSATISNPTSYFGYLQTGTRRMPARPMLGINKEVETLVHDIIQEDVHKKLEAVS